MTPVQRSSFTVAALAAALTLGACASMSGPRAQAQLEPTQGNRVSGTTTFTQQGDRVLVRARVTGLNPGQEHGFHVHEKGDCSSGDGTSAGGHFNPGDKPHGPPQGEHHAGDMPSLRADAHGVADARFTLTGVTVGRGATDIVGRGLIVHAKPDDYRSQPTGDAGARLACAVIR